MSCGSHSLWLLQLYTHGRESALRANNHTLLSLMFLPLTESVPVYHHRAGHGHGGQPELWPFQHSHSYHHCQRHQRQPSHADLQNCELLQIRERVTVCRKHRVWVQRMSWKWRVCRRKRNRGLDRERHYRWDRRENEKEGAMEWGRRKEMTTTLLCRYTRRFTQGQRGRVMKCKGYLLIFV